MKTGIITQILLILNEKVDFKSLNKLKIVQWESMWIQLKVCGNSTLSW